MHASIKYIFPLFVVVFGITGCSSTKSDEPKEIKESVKGEENSVSVDTPESNLIRTGKRLYYAGLYSLAKEHFQSLRNGYPTSPYVEFAEIKSADCSFESREFPAAATAYEEFTKNHPGSKALAYMTYRAGLSYQQAHTGVGRDSTFLEKALEFYNKFLEQFPDSVYAPAVKKFRAETVEALAAHERKIVAFYKKKEKDKAAEGREKIVQEKWEPMIASTAFHEEEAKIEAPQGVKVAISQPTPQTPTAKQAGPFSSPGRGVPTNSTSNRVLRVACSSAGARGVFIYLEKPISDPNFAIKNSTLTPRSG